MFIHQKQFMLHLLYAQKQKYLIHAFIVHVHALDPPNLNKVALPFAVQPLGQLFKCPFLPHQ